METARRMELLANPLIIERFGRWAVEILIPGRVFVAGGAMRAMAEIAISRDGDLRWEPKDLDVFVLHEEDLKLVLMQAEMAGFSIDDRHAPMYGASGPAGSHPVDIVLYEIGVGPEVALSTFDFSVNSIGWDGRNVLFPIGKGNEILEDIGRRRTRVHTGHMFLKRPQRAARRLARLVGLGYEVPEEDLIAYASNFGPPGGH